MEHDEKTGRKLYNHRLVWVLLLRRSLLVELHHPICELLLVLPVKVREENRVEELAALVPVDLPLAVVGPGLREGTKKNRC